MPLPVFLAPWIAKLAILPLWGMFGVTMSGMSAGIFNMYYQWKDEVQQITKEMGDLRLKTDVFQNILTPVVTGLKPYLGSFINVYAGQVILTTGLLVFLIIELRRSRHVQNDLSARMAEMTEHLAATRFMTEKTLFTEKEDEVTEST